LRLDGQATGLLGEGARGGLTRGENPACAHDRGLHEQDIAWGRVEEEGGQRPITFGSSDKTSDGLVEALEAWGAALEEPEHVAMARRQMHMENGPASRGQRTPFLPRMVAFCAAMGTPMQLRYSPPSPSKYHPIERCWGRRALPWNGTKVVEAETMGEWAKTMTWTGMPPIVELSLQVYQKGVALSKRARQAVEARLARHPELPRWDLLIHPVSPS
jgi:hypothetical protein